MGSGFQSETSVRLFPVASSQLSRHAAPRIRGSDTTFKVFSCAPCSTRRWMCFIVSIFEVPSGAPPINP